MLPWHFFYGENTMPIFYAICLWALVSVIGASPSNAADGSYQFKSGGITLTLNRVARHPSGRQLVMSFVVTNNRDEDAGLFLFKKPMVVSDTGMAAYADHVTGIEMCTSNRRFANCAKRIVDPVLIARHNSIVITAVIQSKQPISSCIFDLSMAAVVRHGGTNQQTAWRQVSIGIPNIKIC